MSSVVGMTRLTMALAVVGAALLSACGGSDDGTSTATGGSTLGGATPSDATTAEGTPRPKAAI